MTGDTPKTITFSVTIDITGSTDKCCGTCKHLVSIGIDVGYKCLANFHAPYDIVNRDFGPLVNRRTNEIGRSMKCLWAEKEFAAKEASCT